jgi:uncharacterized membrane protein YfcA
VTAADIVFLIAAGMLAGLVSTVVSLASVVSYPALLAVGLPPLAANVTNTVALVGAGIGAAAGSGPELAGQGRLVARLGAITAVGGATGAALLLLLPASTFQYVAPWLIGGAALLLMRSRRGRRPVAAEPIREHPRAGRAALFGGSIYIGYFGAAGGILMLAVLTALLRQPLARTNAVKNVVSGLANGVAAIGFAVFGPVRWAAALPLAAGFLVGGWVGPALVRRLPAGPLQILVAGCGLIVAVKLGLDAYT